MSTEIPGGTTGEGADAGVPAVPRTRAELRALREAEARAAEARAAEARAAEAAAEPEAAPRSEFEPEPTPRAEENSLIGGGSGEISPPITEISSVAGERESTSRTAEPDPEPAPTPEPDPDPTRSLSEERQRRDETPHGARDSEPEPAPRAEENSLIGGGSGEISPPITEISSVAGERDFSSRTGEPDASLGAAETPDAGTPDAAPPAPGPAKPPRPRPRRFLLALASVLGILVLVGAGLGAAGLLQGPRLTGAQVDAEQAINSSGSRVILTANQALADIDPAQVTVEPEAPFTVDAAGRGVGIRFTVPLDDETKYTVTVAGAEGRGGGPSSDLTWSFTTPASSLFLLKRDAEGADKIFRTGLAGTEAIPVFEHDRIDDFRATSNRLVVSVADDDGSHLLVMDADGTHERELKLPGEGFVGAVQVSERGNLVGYSYSDRELTDTSGRASVLVTQSLSGGDEPQIIEVGGKEANIFAWQFVPDSAAVLFIDFDGALSLVDRAADSGVQSLGLATNILGVSRGTYTAVVERLDGTVVDLDLMDGAEKPITASTPDYGPATRITPFPGGTLRHIVARDEAGMPTGQAIIRVGDDGAAEPLVEVSAADTILQACASPSGQYAAVVVAPQVADNPYDRMLLPLPQKLETHLIDLDSGKELVALTGFDASWCQTAPWF